MKDKEGWKEYSRSTVVIEVIGPLSMRVPSFIGNLAVKRNKLQVLVQSENKNKIST